MEQGTTLENSPSPENIMKTATGFWPSKVLLSAVEFELFTKLAGRSLTAEELGTELGLHERAWYDFFDTLVALKFLDREGDGPEGKYRNAADTDLFLDKNKPSYIGGMPEMLNRRLFGFWNDLEDALMTGKAQNETKGGGESVFGEIYSDPERLETFLEAMTGFQAGNFMMLGEKFDFSRYKTVSDIGGALALLSRVIAGRHEHLTFTSFDLPPVAPHARNRVDAAGLTDRIKIVEGDFFKDELPPADVITMGMILHDWNLEDKKMLIRKAYDALPEGGAFIAVEHLIDDARRENIFGLLMSLNMLIEFGEAFDFSGADFRGWCSEVGFKEFDVLHLAGPAFAAVAYK
ncbi:MAG: methyltransferase [Pyrinomonadaceae bacterium]|nr:methyltransferase [Pyrinomonadaceae bacterium]